MNTISTDDKNEFSTAKILPFKSFGGSQHLPPDCGPLAFDRLIEDHEGIRVVALTDCEGRPSIGIAKINQNGKLIYGDGSEGGIICFEHDAPIVQRDIKIGFLIYKINVRLDGTGMTICVSYSLSNFFSDEPAFSQEVPWNI